VPYRLAMTRQVRDWLHALRSGDPVTRRLVAEAIDRLLDDGPVRMLFVFDPVRNVVQLVADDKSGRWKEWYAEAIPVAEAAYEAYLKGWQ
jgi:hypothetical protein